MASSALFQALLLASSLGWNGVFAQEQYSNGQNTTSDSFAPTAFAPQIEESHASLGVPAASTTTTPPTSKITSPPTFYSPVLGHPQPSLDLPSSSPHLVPAIPVIGQSDSSLDLPTLPPLTTHTKPTFYPGPSLGLPPNEEPSTSTEVTSAYPVVQYSQSSLNVPENTSSSSTEVVFAPSPVVQPTQTSLDVPDKPTQSGHHGGGGDGPQQHTSWVQLTPVIGKSESTLLVPGTTSTTPSPTWRRPNTEHTQPSLHVPGRPTGYPGEGEQPGETFTGPSLLSPATGYSQTKLSVPPTTTIIAESPIVAISQTGLDTPTGYPGNNNGLVPTISLPPENPHGGHGNGRPIHHGQHNNNGNAGQEPQEDNLPNPGGIIASLAHDHGQEWQGHQGGGEDQNQNQNQNNGAIVAPLTTDTQPPTHQGSTYHVAGTQIVAGASAATVDGTTYSLAPSGKGIVVNGQMTEFSGPAATDSVAMAVMSALGGKGGSEASESESARPSSTMATTTTSEVSSAVQSSEGGAVAQQTGNAAAAKKKDVLSGLGLGGLGVVMALL